ncbi:MAG: hypothetical protein C4292_05035, partial [Nitrososphaera sp.]
MQQAGAHRSPCHALEKDACRPDRQDNVPDTGQALSRLRRGRDGPGREDGPAGNRNIVWPQPVRNRKNLHGNRRHWRH